MLKIENLSVRYGSVRALSDVDLEVLGDGILHGVIGPNGAGKSTLLDAVCGRRRPSRGNRSLSKRGYHAALGGLAAPAGHGAFVPATSVFQDLTVHEQLRLGRAASRR